MTKVLNNPLNISSAKDVEIRINEDSNGRKILSILVEGKTALYVEKIYGDVSINTHVPLEIKISTPNKIIASVIRSRAKQWCVERFYNSLHQINEGDCFDFAHEVKLELKEQDIEAEVLFGPGHVWLAHEGRHYDAEHPGGVTDPTKLSYYLRDDECKSHLEALLQDKGVEYLSDEVRVSFWLAQHDIGEVKDDAG